MKDSKLRREALWGVYDKRCAYCEETTEFRNITTEHIIPKSTKEEVLKQKIQEYGLDKDFHVNDLSNLLPACPRCNSSKGDRPYSAKGEYYYLNKAIKAKEKVEKRLKWLEKIKKNKYPRTYPEPWETKRIVTYDDHFFYANSYSYYTSDVFISGHLPSRNQEQGSCIINFRLSDTIPGLCADDIEYMISRKEKGTLEKLLYRGKLTPFDEELIMVTIGNSTVYLFPEIYNEFITILSDFLDTYKNFLQTEYIDFLTLNGFEKKDAKYYVLMETTRDKWRKLLEYSYHYCTNANSSESTFRFSYNNDYILAIDKETDAIAFELIPDTIQKTHFKDFQYPDNRMQILWRVPSTMDRKYVSTNRVFTLMQTYEWVRSILEQPLKQNSSKVFKYLKWKKLLRI